ncbi:MAG: 2,3-bisphosphoglycerate-dependent phosphoglycerate mutase [Pseudomonas fluorescens]|nr:MAG: 2,3-bisphosphoglycerate-dependent phosphoglycerate mutase [Pseudomonas fluorescens]
MTTHTLILTRHGQSDGNKRNVFTGWLDLPLTEQGEQEARNAGQRLKAAGLTPSVAFSSELQRAMRTCDLMLEELGQADLSVTRNSALNERDYGNLNGLNKDEARAKWGEEQVHIWRRAYDTPPPGGESLRDTVARVLPYYVNKVLPQVLSNETTLVAAHGNSLRALIMALEGIPSEEIPSVELATGEIYVYKLDNAARILDKQILKP